MDSLYQWLIEPYQYEFMQRALIAGLCVSLVCAVLSCFLVLKGWSLMGDAISHAVLPGIVIAYVLQIALPIGAFVSGLLCALQTGYIKNHTRLKEDTVLGIVYSGMLALGLVLFTKIKTDQHLLHILFGNMLGINNTEYHQTIIISLIVFLIIVVFHRQLMLYCFDASHARVIGLPTQLIHYAFMILISLTVVAAIQAVGVIMVVALLISPGITALLIVKRFTTMLLISCMISITSILLGTLISFHIDGATSACIVLVQACFFAVTLFLSYVRTAMRNRHSTETI